MRTKNLINALMYWLFPILSFILYNRISTKMLQDYYHFEGNYGTQFLILLCGAVAALFLWYMLVRNAREDSTIALVGIFLPLPLLFMMALPQIDALLRISILSKIYVFFYGIPVLFAATMLFVYIIKAAMIVKQKQTA